MSRNFSDSFWVMVARSYFVLKWASPMSSPGLRPMGKTVLTLCRGFGREGRRSLGSAPVRQNLFIRSVGYRSLCGQSSFAPG